MTLYEEPNRLFRAAVLVALAGLLVLCASLSGCIKPARVKPAAPTSLQRVFQGDQSYTADEWESKHGH